jgi:nucleoside-diphosphate-sugar epimerase
MRIAILGATSMLAADYVATAIGQQSPHAFTLFARDPARARAAMLRRGVPAVLACAPLDRFAEERWDAIVNFIGAGDPARAVAMGASILTITREWDERVLAYLEAHAECRYLFLSSGAALGTGHADPIGPATRACFDLNALPPSAYYGIAKFYAEAGHRARPGRSIVDLRIFNYLSEFADLDHRFLATEMIAAVRDGRTLGVDGREMWRDYLGREDLAALVTACLAAPPGHNGTVDAYSRAPVSKTEMLNLFRERFGLRFDVTSGGIDATGTKSRYYSLDRAAELLGYRPRHDSLDTLTATMKSVLRRS